MLPFHPDAPNLGLQFLEDLPHGWTDTHDAWNGGKYDQWVPSKGTTTMAYLTRDDIPFHYALADAFTVCDAYHCSLLGATDPNRYHMWTGWVGNDGKNGGPVLNNAEAGYDWSTYPRAPAGRRHLLEDLSGRRARASTPPTSGAGATTRTSATTATTRCSTSTSTRTRSRAARSTRARCAARTSPRAARCSISSSRTC